MRLPLRMTIHSHALRRITLTACHLDAGAHGNRRHRREPRVQDSIQCEGSIAMSMKCKVWLICRTYA